MTAADRAKVIAKWTIGFGVACFLAGFVGPIILAPDSNQGPLLGIFITGPLGAVAGFVIGVVRQFMLAADARKGEAVRT